jgi:hypothetical protein
MSAITKNDSTYRVISQQCFERGEKLDYRVHYGFINAGEATMQVDSVIHTINNRPCYKVDVFGRTKGFFDLVMHVRDNWGSYVDTSAIVPQKFYQTIEEGKYMKKEIIEFDQLNNVATAHRLDGKTGDLKGKKNFDVPSNIQDIVSGYYYLRTFDYDTIKPDQIFTLTGFFDDTTYNVQVRYLGKDRLKTKVGTFDAHVMSPIMPKNQFFRGKNPVRAWLSDDEKRIPLKVKAELLIGSVQIDIKGYRKSRN